VLFPQARTRSLHRCALHVHSIHWKDGEIKRYDTVLTIISSTTKLGQVVSMLPAKRTSMSRGTEGARQHRDVMHSLAKLSMTTPQMRPDILWLQLA
jgi:hypothetical protein